LIASDWKDKIRLI